MNFRNQHNSRSQRHDQGSRLLQNPNNRDNQVRADNKAIMARRNEAQVQTWSWITGKEALEAACLDLLRGVPKLYPMFGIQLLVEMRQGAESEFPVLVFHDALYGEEGQKVCGQIRPGFWVPANKLGYRAFKQGAFKSPSEEILVLALLNQPEMQVARAKFFAEEDSKQQALFQKRDTLLAELRAKVAPILGMSREPSVSEVPSAPKTKIVYPTFLSVKQILDDGIGVFQPTAGVTIKVCNSLDGLVIRVQTRDEAHPAYGFSKNNLYFTQMDVVKGMVPTIPDEKFIEEKVMFMDWLQDLLETGDQPAPVADKVKDAPADEQSAEVVAPDSAPAVLEAPASEAFVDEILGAGANNGVTEGAKKSVPAKRVVKSRGVAKPACELAAQTA